MGFAGAGVGAAAKTWAVSVAKRAKTADNFMGKLEWEGGTLESANGGRGLRSNTPVPAFLLPSVATVGAGDSAEAAEEFARTDPYVINGVVKSWSVREWTTVVGEDATTKIDPNSL